MPCKLYTIRSSKHIPSYYPANDTLSPFWPLLPHANVLCLSFKQDFNRSSFNRYWLVNDFPPNLFETLGLRETFIEGHNFLLDPLESYINCLQNFFNFEWLRLWVMRFPKRMVIGVAGGQMEMYAKMIFGELLGM